MRLAWTTRFPTAAAVRVNLATLPSSASTKDVLSQPTTRARIANATGRYTIIPKWIQMDLLKPFCAQASSVKETTNALRATATSVTAL